MPIPTLTFSQRDIQNAAGAADGKQLLVLIRDHLATSPTPAWNVSVSTDGTNHTSGGNQAPYLELSFATNIGSHPCKLIIACSDTAIPDDANIIDTGVGTAYRYTQNKGTNQMWVGMAQKGPALGGADPFAAPVLYGGGNDWTGYYRAVQNVSDINGFWFVDSAEVCGIFFQNASDEIFGFMWGAVVKPLSDLAGSRQDGSGNGRTFGIYAFGPNNATILNSMNSNNQGGGFLSHGRGSTNSIYDHQPISHAYDIGEGNVATPMGAIRGPNELAASTDPTYPNGTFRDPVGNMAAPPILVCSASNTQSEITNPHLIGVLRQMKFMENSKCRTPVLNSGGTVIGFAVSGSLTDNKCAVMISQS